MTSIREKLPLLLFLAALFLVYPNRLIIGAPEWILFGFSTASLTLLAGGAILLVPGRFRELSVFPWWFHAAGITFAALLLWHTAYHDFPAADGATSFSYLIIPAFAYLYRRELRKYLPWIITALWCLTLIQSLYERFAMNTVFIGGLAMNKNWNSALILGGAPFAAWTWYRATGGNWRKFLRIALPCAVIAGYILFVCDTLAVLPVLLGTGAALFIAFARNRKKALLITGGLCAFFCVLVFLLKDTPSVQHFLERDDRIFYYVQTPALIADAPVAGHGPAAFEQAFLPYRTLDYFLKPYAADRIDHPHNHLLYMAAGVGLTGLAAWVILWIVPAVFSCRFVRRPEWCIYLAGWLIFAWHSQFDLIMERPPCNVLALLLTGMLWRALPHTGMNRKRWSRIICIPGAALIIAGVVMAGMNFYASWHFRKGERLAAAGDPRNRYHYEQCMKADGWDNTAFYRYQTALRYCTNRKEEQQTALRLLESFDKMAVPDFAHIHFLRGRLLLSQGKTKEGLHHLMREAELYPADPYPLLALWNYYIVNRQQNGAAAVASELNNRLALLQLDAKIEEAFPASWRDARIKGIDGEALLTNPRFNAFKNVRRLDFSPSAPSAKK